MVEGECSEVSEEEFMEAVTFGRQAVHGVLDLMEKMRQAVGKPKWEFEKVEPPEGLAEKVRELALEPIQAACREADKAARGQAFRSAKREIIAELSTEYPESERFIERLFENLQYKG
jgi:polyribonucleotide nucleotidyltransferase